MSTRYQQFQRAIANLAAPAAEQRAHLEEIFPDHGSPLPASFNTDELGLEFDDIYLAAGDMLECGEISQGQVDAAKPLADFLKRLSGGVDAGFWTVAALFTDARWNNVRQLASEALRHYPKEAQVSRFST